MNEKPSKKFSGKRVALIVVIVIAALPTMPYIFNTVKCGGLPLTGSTFAAGYTYQLPGDTGYIDLFNSEYFCSEAEAKAAGFHRTTFAN